ncbi:hypothetical protein SCHPADRAFT_999544 [Schizopora paradoxa]|uniref:Uncharacterized protein n=1 Tax=Schizopora paradoxa TaxID=27342 RepID=A0A0H2RFC4_9AGAM|nr:hypothetical protein SCHPADRAFT_999544 [Schizopora paradoxa]
MQTPITVLQDGSEAVVELSSELEYALEPGGELCTQLVGLQRELQTDLSSISFQHTSSTLSEDKTRLARAQESLRELDTAGSLLKQLKRFVDAQRQAVREKVNFMALRIGFSSLPDEILSEILVLATRPLQAGTPSPEFNIHVPAEMQGLHEARSLSHVCRRFRALMLNTPRIWNIISENMVDTSRIRTYIERSKKVGMDILLENYGLRQRGRNSFALFIKFCLLSSRHWRSFTIGRFAYNFEERFRPNRCWETIRDNLQIIGQLTGRLYLPNLKRLIVYFNHVESEEHWETKFHPYWQWVMPRLVELRITGCHPPPADVSFVGSLRHFKIRFNAEDGRAYDMVQLVQFLSSCEVLEKIELDFASWLSVTPCALQGVASVQDVTVSFYCCKPAACLAICESVYFPNASNLKFQLASSMDFETHDKKLPPKRERLMREFLLRHPLTKTFHLDYGSNDQSFTPIIPPIGVLPALEKLVLTFESWEELRFWPSSSSSGDPRLPPIRILELHTFSLSEWDCLSYWVERFFDQMKMQGDLDNFELLAIYEVDGETDPSKLEGKIYDYLPLEKIRTSTERQGAH